MNFKGIVENMSELDKAWIDEQYEEYLVNHISNVQKGFNWLVDNGIVTNNFDLGCNIANHDQSKYGSYEYIPYAYYFYAKNLPDKKLSKEEIKVIDEAFDNAWNHHQKTNPHHWQYWMLIKDSGKKDFVNKTTAYIALDMPEAYIVEMFCDWWAFSWKSGNLKEVFTWYEEHKNSIVLSEKSREKLENLMSKVKEIL